MKSLHRRLDKLPMPDPDAPDHLTVTVDLTHPPPAATTYYAAHGDTLREITRGEYEAYEEHTGDGRGEIVVNLLPEEDPDE